jgi:hypothetical protein
MTIACELRATRWATRRRGLKARLKRRMFFIMNVVSTHKVKLEPNLRIILMKSQMNRGQEGAFTSYLQRDRFSWLLVQVGDRSPVIFPT